MLIVGIIALFLWLGNGLLVAQLRADAVKVDGTQMAGLSESFAKVCKKLEIGQIPELYVLQSGGLLNAFTTRHCGRNFVVVFSELLEAYGPTSAEIEFLLGHELGHIRRSHVLKKIFLAPGLLFPLLGNAYSRACEMSCDRHGAFAASQIQGALNAVMVLAGGRNAGSVMNPVSFAEQYAKHRGFFVSWYELISGYPTLSQRLANLLAIGDNRTLTRVRRNPLAYPFALFSLSGAHSGGGNVMITVAVIGLLAAIAIPSFVKARETAQCNACINNMRIIEVAKEQAAVAHNHSAGDTVTEQEVSQFIKNGVCNLRCMKGGHYTIHPLGQDAACSVHGALSEAFEKGQRFPNQPSDRTR
jgi:Zn-dependent protease with chaperone function